MYASFHGWLFCFVSCLSRDYYTKSNKTYQLLYALEAGLASQWNEFSDLPGSSTEMFSP
jgi:hypothetical protein